MGRELPLEEDAIIFSDIDPQCDIEAREQASFIRRAVLAMEQPDREIFLRHYYYFQPVSQIAEEMQINSSTVKTRLRRGRSKLKDILCEGGYHVDDKDL